MESKIHKHYKEHLICPGMTILSSGQLLTINDVETEVCLNKKFNTNWNKRIVVDILASTNKGFVAIEVYKTNPKLWATLSEYYDDISDKVINFFEVRVFQQVNLPPIWKDRKLLLKEDPSYDYEYSIRSGDFYFGTNSQPYKVNENLYQVKCVHRFRHDDSTVVTLQFNLQQKYFTEKRIVECFSNIQDIVSCTAKYKQITENLYECISFYNPKRPNGYRCAAGMTNKIRNKLLKMKKQNKIIYAKQ